MRGRGREGRVGKRTKVDVLGAGVGEVALDVDELLQLVELAVHLQNGDVLAVERVRPVEELDAWEGARELPAAGNPRHRAALIKQVTEEYKTHRKRERDCKVIESANRVQSSLFLLFGRFFRILSGFVTSLIEWMKERQGCV